MKTITPFLAILISGIFIILTGCRQNSEEKASLRNVILTTAMPLAAESSTTYSGIVEEGESVNASFMADGKIAQILVKEGDRVRKGQLLAALDDSDYRIGVSQLETQYNQMTKEKERMDAMYARHNIAPNDYEKFEAGYKQLKLQLDMAKRQLGYTQLYSPTDGYIAIKYLNQGELTGAGTPVFNIVNDSRLTANVDLPVGVYLEKNKITSAYGTVPGIEGNIPLTVISFTPDADNNMLYHMKLSIPSSVTKDLTPGMNIVVCLETSGNSGDEVTVPSRSIVSKDGKTYVWLFNPNDSTISRHEVQIEGGPIGKMNVVKGLKSGSTIVETGVRQLYDGEKVNVLNRNDIGI